MENLLIQVCMARKGLILVNSKNLRTIRKLIAYENFQDYSMPLFVTPASSTKIYSVQKFATAKVRHLRAYENLCDYSTYREVTFERPVKWCDEMLVNGFRWRLLERKEDISDGRKIESAFKRIYYVGSRNFLRKFSEGATWPWHASSVQGKKYSRTFLCWMYHRAYLGRHLKKT